MKKRVVASIIWVALTSTGCVSVPDQLLLVNHRGDTSTVHVAERCVVDPRVHSSVSTFAQQAALNSNDFSLLSWNMFKGKRGNWEEDLRRLNNKKDLLIIQEAYLTNDLKGLLQHRPYHWDLATAFEYRHIKSGVLTASTIAPSFVCALVNKEPLTGIPKTILITQYPLSGSDLRLMVVNVHLINFTLATSSFRAQLQQLEHVLSKHTGPLIVSGDFNTWSDKRMAIVDATTDRLALKAVTFAENNRTVVLGNHVDHIYYRGLELIEATSTPVTTSDHNPLLVRFRLACVP